MQFDWDRRKASANFTKHGVTFEEAITTFADPFALVAPDTGHSTPEEERRWLIGQGESGVLVVVFTVRSAGNLHRLISARRAGRKERKRYEEARGISV